MGCGKKRTGKTVNRFKDLSIPLDQPTDRTEEAMRCIEEAKNILARCTGSTHLLKNRVGMVVGFASLYLETKAESSLDRALVELARLPHSTDRF